MFSAIKHGYVCVGVCVGSIKHGYVCVGVCAGSYVHAFVCIAKRDKHSDMHKNTNFPFELECVCKHSK